MSSKLDKFRKIAAQTPQEQIESNKNTLVLGLASLPKNLIQENSENLQASIVSDNTDNLSETLEDEIGRQNRKIIKEDISERQDVNIIKEDDSDRQNKNIVEEDDLGSDNRNKEVEDSSSILISKDFSDRVTTGVSQFIENKITKEETHKKVGFLLRNDLRMKLENFDKAHGGRIKGEFVNTLLENFFDELETSSPQWKKILNKKIPNFK